MKNGKFSGQVRSTAVIHEKAGGKIGKYRGKFPAKAQNKPEVSEYDMGHDRKGDEDEWKKGGAILYRLGNGFYDENGRLLSERSEGEDASVESKDSFNGSKMVYVSPVDGDLYMCFRGHNARFWSSGSRGFCAYYERFGKDEYGVNLAVFTSNDTAVTRVSGTTFTEREAKRAPPVMVVRTEGDKHKVVFPFIVQKEKMHGSADSELSSLYVRQYTISERNNRIEITKLSNVLVSGNYLGFGGPLGVTINPDGDIVVVGKFKDPIRLSSSDVGYFAWKFSGADLSLKQPKGSHKHENTYLFRRFGGSAYRNSERIIVWDDVDEDQLSLTHIDKYLTREHSTYSTVYTARNVDMQYRNEEVESCIIESFRCGIFGTKVSLSQNKDVHLIDKIEIAGTRYIFYISKVNGEKANGNVDLLMFNGDNYVMIEGILHVGFSAMSLSVNPINGENIGIFLTEKSGRRANVYEIPSGDELLKPEVSIKTSVIDCDSIGRQEFIDIVNGELFTHSGKETVTDFETSITKGSFRDIGHHEINKGNIRVVEYVYEHKKSDQSPVDTTTEKDVQSDLHAGHHTLPGRETHEHQKRSSNAVETTTDKGLQSEEYTDSHTSTSWKVHDKESDTVTTSTKSSTQGDSSRMGEVTTDGTHRHFSFTVLNNVMSPTVGASSSNPSQGVVQGTQIDPGGSGSGSSGIVGRIANFSTSLRESLHIQGRGNNTWIISGIMAILFLITVCLGAYKLMTRHKRGESNLYRDMYNNAIEEDVSFIRLEPRDATADEIQSTLIMDSISESLVDNDCRSVHEL